MAESPVRCDHNLDQEFAKILSPNADLEVDFARKKHLSTGGKESMKGDTSENEKGNPGNHAEERLRAAQAAFERYYTQCFWYMDRSLEVTESSLPKIVDGLRSHGDRRAFQIAEELCH